MRTRFSFLSPIVACVTACAVFAGVPAASRAASGPATCGTVIVPTGVGNGPPAPVTSLSPLLSTAVYAHQMFEQIYRPLVWTDRNEKPDPSRGLAQSVDTPDGGLTFIVTLHDWLWSDGVPVTADDLLFTIDLVRKLGPAYVYYGTGGMPTLIRSARALSPHQVELRMVRKVNPAWFISLGLSNVFFPLPKHVYAGLSLVDIRRRQNDPALFKVSDSAFLLKEFSIGRHLVFEPNPLYGGHHPQIRRLVVAFPNGNEALEELRSGALDMAAIPYLLSKFAARLPGFDIVRPTPNFTYGDGYFNMRSARAPFLADLSVRRAIIRGIDQQEIIDLVYSGHGAIDHGPVPGSMSAMQSEAARAGYPDLSYDPVAARALLAADGWRPGPDGILARNGQRLAFEIETSSEGVSGTIQAQVIQRNLRALGMDVSLHMIGFNQLLATLDGNGQPWDLVTLSWSIPAFPDVHDFFASDGSENYGHYRDAHMDALNRDVMFGDGDDALHAVQDYAAEQAPHLYLPGATPALLVRPGLGGVTDFLSPNSMWSPELLTLSGPLACPADVAEAAHAPHA